MNFIENINLIEGRSVRAGEGAAKVASILGKEASAHCFHYCAPTHGGWGVIRTAMLVPEMYMLFVCPAACGRHGAIAAIEQGCKDRVGYLCIEENEVVLGSYQEAIREAIPQLLDRLNPKPKAFMVVVSCIDDLLGTDYEEMIADFESTFRIPFRLGRMNPISQDTKLPPALRIQRDMYDFLEPPEEPGRFIAHIGAFQPIQAWSEIRRLLHENAGLDLRHISEFDSFAEFQHLASAKMGLITRPEGVEAAQNLRRKIGMPFLFAPTSFSYASIAETYEKISDQLGCDLDLSGPIFSRKIAEGKCADLAKKYSISIDDSATCSPFDMARALVEAGFCVKEIFTHKLPSYELRALEWLAKNSPETRITSPIHHSNSWSRSASASSDIAIGFTAGYLSQATHVVPMAFDEGLFGHHGMQSLLDQIAMATGAPNHGGLESMVRSYGFVV